MNWTSRTRSEWWSSCAMLGACYTIWICFVLFKVQCSFLVYVFLSQSTFRLALTAWWACAWCFEVTCCLFLEMWLEEYKDTKVLHQDNSFDLWCLKSFGHQPMLLMSLRFYNLHPLTKKNAYLSLHLVQVIISVVACMKGSQQFQGSSCLFKHKSQTLDS